jgi:hypothetical protein
MFVGPAVDFDQHKRWDDEHLGSLVDQVDASLVVGIARVEEREIRPVSGISANQLSGGPGAPRAG